MTKMDVIICGKASSEFREEEAMTLHVIWTICKKDLRIWATRRVQILGTLLVPLTYILVIYLGADAVGSTPVAVVNLDQGPTGASIVRSMAQTDAFRLSQVSSPQQAQGLYQHLQVAAILTIPADFSQRVHAHAQAPLYVRVNNLNSDLANDIRRDVPYTITTYYQTLGAANPIQVTVAEQRLRPQTVELFQYAVLPLILLLITVNGIISSGLAAALEFDKQTVKEVLLALCGTGAIMVGKVLSGWLTTTALGTAMLVLGALLGWTVPQGLHWLAALLVIALGSLFASSAGMAIATCFQRLHTVMSAANRAAIYLFALAGGVGIIFFEPLWLQRVAQFDPLTYAIHALQQSVFYASSAQFGRDIAVLALTSLAAMALAIWAMQRGMRQVS